MMTKEQKKNYVEEMKKVFSSNEAVMIAHYKGLNVKELDKIRSEMRESGIFFKVTNDNIRSIKFNLLLILLGIFCFERWDKSL